MGVNEEKIEKIKKVLISEEIKHIYLNFVDFSGNILTKMVGVKELINNTHVSWFNGISINGKLIEDFTNDINSDWLVIVPIPETFRVLNFVKESEQKSAMIMCQIKNYELDTRRLLVEATNEALKKGFCPIAGTELIYGIEEDKDINQNFYSCLATSKSSRFNNYVVNNLINTGIDIEYYMPYGNNHNRIDLVPDIIIKSADKLFTSKWFIKNISLLLNYQITFDSFNENNMSTCPVHLSIWNKNKENNLFFDPKDEFELSDIGKCFINGILYYNKFILATIKATTKFKTNTFISTYSIERDNAVIQVPLYFKEKLKKDRIGWSKRCLFQAINADCNIYLVFASLLYAGLYGIENNIKRCKKEKMDYTREELIKEVENNDFFRKKMGKKIINKIIEKLKEE